MCKSIIADMIGALFSGGRVGFGIDEMSDGNAAGQRGVVV